jgi:exopolysaccharide production protein ExoY
MNGRPGFRSHQAVWVPQAEPGRAATDWGLDAETRGKSVGSLGDHRAAASVATPAAAQIPPASPVSPVSPPSPQSSMSTTTSPDLRGQPTGVEPPLSRPARSRAKRALDLGVTVVLSPIIVPLGLLCAVLIKATSSGPVLFAQERVGLRGERFRMYKFRTMHVDAERLLQQDARLWQQYVDNGFKLPAELDRRVTPLGRFLRRSSLDELPQMLNVLAGTMSLVGPRPVVPAEVANYGDRQSVYFSARPGITGAWQVNGRSTVDYPERVDIDADYVRSWSLWRDVRILVRTPLAVLSTRGAH